MSSGLDWRTDEEQEWERPLTAPRTRQQRRRRWPWLIAMLLILFSGGVIYQQMQQRIESTTGRVEDDVRAAHNVRQQAVATEDAELYRSILSGSSPEWAATQQILLDEGLLGTAHPLNGVDTSVTVESIVLDPDLDAAEVQVRQRLAGGGTLLRSDVYRRGTDRWLYAPPEDAFWGKQQAVETPEVTVIYPERDAVFAERWMEEIARWLRRACGLTACGSQEQIVVTFSRDPLHLKLSADVQGLWRTGRFVTLPAPSLFGTPADEDAYGVLARFYAQKVVAAAISQWTDYACCEQEFFFRALLNVQLESVGLGALPADNVQVPEQQAAALLAHPDPLGAVRGVWEAPRQHPADLWLVNSFVDYLLSSDAAGMASRWQRSLATSPSLNAWLGGTESSTVREIEAVNGWLRAADARVQQPLPTLPVGNSVALLCETPAEHVLWYVDPTSRSWRQMATLPGPERVAVSLTARPAGGDFVVEQVPVGSNRSAWTTALWNAGGRAAVFDNGAQTVPLSFSGRFGVTGRQLLMYSRDEDFGRFQFSLLDLDECADGDCPVDPLEGLPLWSPGGENTILVSGSRLTLGDARGRELQRPPIGRGFTPFWLSEDVYGFLRVLSVSNRDGVLTPINGLSIRSLSDDTAIYSLSADELRTMVPQDVAPEKLFVEYVTSHPGQPGVLLAVAAGPGREGFYIFTIDGLVDVVRGREGAAPDIRFLTRLELVPTEFRFGPDPRWVALAATAGDEPGLAAVVALDLRTGQVEQRPFYFTTVPDTPRWLHWSADGQTLLIAGEAGLHFWQPGTGRDTRLYHDRGVCTAAAWLE